MNVIGIDWLTISAKKGLSLTDSSFSFSSLDYRNRFFYDSVIISYLGNEIATMDYSPRSDILHKSLVLIKIHNPVLYSSSSLHLISTLCRSLGLYDIKISRLDIFCDFDITVSNDTGKMLIDKLLDKSYVRVGKSSMAAIGLNNRGLNANYIRYGKRSSDVCTYLYNKSLELQQIKDKPYIRQMWDAAGFRTSDDIFRLEFSLNDYHTINYARPDDTFPIHSFEEVFRKKNLVSLFNSLISKYFYIVVNDGRKRLDRMKSVPLFADLQRVNSLRLERNVTDDERFHKTFIVNLLRSVFEKGYCDDGMNDEALTLCYNYARRWKLIDYMYLRMGQMSRKNDNI